MTIVQEIHRGINEGDYQHQEEAINRLQGYTREKEVTTFSSLMSLQHYASSLAYQSLSMPTIWWLDREKWDSMLYRGRKITHAQLVQVFKNIEKGIVELWETKVMLGLGLRVDYGELCDNLTRTDAGYCFLDDEQNPFLQHANELSDQVFRDPKLLEEFTYEVVGTGERQLNHVQAREWLTHLAEHESLLMLSVDMKAGATHGTELAAMLVRNTLATAEPSMCNGHAEPQTRVGHVQ